MRVTKFNLRQPFIRNYGYKFKDYIAPFKFDIAEYAYVMDLEAEFEKNKLNLAPTYCVLNEEQLIIDAPYLQPMVMAVDPGTTSMGITLGSLTEPQWNYLTTYRFQRGSTEDASTFTSKFIELLKYMLKTFNIIELVIETQYDGTEKYFSKINKNNIDKLKTIRQMMEGTFRIHNLPVTSIVPNTWKADFLGPVKETYGIKRLNASNKEFVHQRCVEMFINYITLPKSTDSSDSIGILYCFFNKSLSQSKHRPDHMDAKEIVRGAGQIRNIKGFVKKIVVLSNNTDIQHEIQKVVTEIDKEANRQNLALIPIEFNHKMTVEENLRTALANNKAVYYGIFTLKHKIKKNGPPEPRNYFKIIPELYDLFYENGLDTATIPNINPDTIIIAYGYST